jgi:hypothetical protein
MQASVTVDRRQRRLSGVPGRAGTTAPLTVPENTGLMGEARGGAGSLAPNTDPGLGQRLVYPGGNAQAGDLPVPGRVELVLAIAEDQACALSQQGSPPGRSLRELGDRGSFLVGGQPPAVSGSCRRSLGLCDEETVGGDTAHAYQDRMCIL